MHGNPDKNSRPGIMRRWRRRRFESAMTVCREFAYCGIIRRSRCRENETIILLSHRPSREGRPTGNSREGVFPVQVHGRARAEESEERRKIVTRKLLSFEHLFTRYLTEFLLSVQISPRSSVSVSLIFPFFFPPFLRDSPPIKKSREPNGLLGSFL